MATLTKLTGITLPGTYPKLFNFFRPTFPNGNANLAGLWGMGGAIDFAQKNLLTRATDLSITGTPVMQKIGADLSYQNYLTSGAVFGTADYSIIVIARPVVATNAATSFNLASQLAFAGPTGDGLSINSSGLTLYSSHASGSSASTSLSLAGANPANWNIFAGRVKSTGERKVWWGRDGATVSGAESAADGSRAINTTRGWRIGADYVNTYLATNRIAMVALFNNAPTDAEMAANIAYLRSTLANPVFGITTV